MKLIIQCYLGVDGACAAAEALRTSPDAELVLTSARRIGSTLSMQNAESSIHVCGVGVDAEVWNEVETACEALKAQGTRVIWHCGRGYLDALKFSSLPIEIDFLQQGTNTATVGDYFNTSEDDVALDLKALATWDPGLDKDTSESPPRELAQWLDLIEACQAHYLKYQDATPYLECITKLASGIFDRGAQGMVDAFHNTGWHNVHHARSPVMRGIKQRILKCAQSPWPVLVLGESGVGKEHVAHLLHEGATDHRAHGPFIPVNCAQYAGNIALANSDLFGHVKGAFTGADRDRKGKFIEAHTGTIFLDELGELPLEVQAKLLRVLEDGRVTPEGGDTANDAVDVRVIGATNRDLQAMIQAGIFREDLYHRLSTLCITVPPLRDRIEDLEIIIDQHRDTLKAQGHSIRLSKADWLALKNYIWPGNVRQLIKILNRKAVFGDAIAALLVEEQQGSVGEGAHNDLTFPASLRACPEMDEMKRAYAEHVWALCSQNVAAASRALGVRTNTLRYNYLKEHVSGKSEA